MHFWGLQLPIFRGYVKNSGLRANNHENLGYIRKFRGRSVFFVVGNPENLVTVLTVTVPLLSAAPSFEESEFHTSLLILYLTSSDRIV
jgi:hypothetical protein